MLSPPVSSSASPSSASPGGRIGTREHPDLACLWNSLRVFRSNSFLFQILRSPVASWLTITSSEEKSLTSLTPQRPIKASQRRLNTSKENSFEKVRPVHQWEAPNPAAGTWQWLTSIVITPIYIEGELNPISLGSKPQWPLPMPLDVNLFFNHLLRSCFPSSEMGVPIVVSAAFRVRRNQSGMTNTLGCL